MWFPIDLGLYLILIVLVVGALYAFWGPAFPKDIRLWLPLGVLVGMLIGTYADGIRFYNGTRVHFYATPGQGVDPASVTIGRFFSSFELLDDPANDKQLIHVFGFPLGPRVQVATGFQPVAFQLPGFYRCFYEKNGAGYYKDYKSPPVPPCP